MKKNNELPTPQRERTSVAISGLDNSTSDDLVLDGKCASLNNVRYEAGAWRPVHEHHYETLGAMPEGMDIVYHHPIAGKSVVIGMVHGYDEERQEEHYQYYSYHMGPEEATLIADFTSERTISHFGNVLMFNSTDRTSYYLYQDGNYLYINSITESPYIYVNSGNKKASTTPYVYWKVDKEIHIGTDTPIMPNMWHPAFGDGNVNYFKQAITAIAIGTADVNISVAYPLYNISQDRVLPSIQNGRILGNIAFFAAYRMADGEVLGVSPLHISHRDAPYNVARIFKGHLEGKDVHSNATFTTEDEFIWAESNPVLVENNTLTLEDDRLCPALYSSREGFIYIPENIRNSKLCESVAIYATRANSPFSVEKMMRITEESSLIDIFYTADDIINQPFYLVKEFFIDEFRHNSDGLGIGTLSIDLTQYMTTAETKPIYSPRVRDYIHSKISLDYNNRLHLANITTHYGRIDIFNNPFATSTQATDYFYRAGLELQETAHTVKRYLSDNSHRASGLTHPYSRVLSYPSADIKAFLIHDTIKNFVYRYLAKASLSNAIAYYVANPTNEYQFPPIDITNGEQIPLDTIHTSRSVTDTNRIQVSATNNNFSFPYENSYRVGSSLNEIIALQSAAIEMPEMKVGEMPLFAFTTEGIFTLIAGSETLYARISPINYDKIINPNTLAINGAIVYITEQGVHLLTSQGSSIISTPIHDKANRPPLDFLRKCKLIYPKEHNEIILYNEDGRDDADTEAYIYSLDGGYWSTRDLVGKKLNTDELYIDTYEHEDRPIIANLTKENMEKPLNVSLRTRPIKLGNMEFKRIESYIPRIYTGVGGFNSRFIIYGSVDGESNTVMRDDSFYNAKGYRNDPYVFRRTPFSAKYFTIQINLLNIKPGLVPSFTHIDFEWYAKLRHRMR